MILIADIITSVLQACFFSVPIYWFTERKSINKVLITILMIFMTCAYFTSKFGNLSLCVVLIHLLILLIVSVIYKTERKEAIIAFSIAYCFLSLIIIFFECVFWFFI